MTAAGAIVAMEVRLLGREPAALFFLFALPAILLALIGSADDIGDDLVPGLIGLVIATAAVASLPEHIAGYRERGVLRRFFASPVRPATLIAAEAVFFLALVAVGAAGLTVAAQLAFGAAGPHSPAAAIAAIAASSAALLSFGALLAAMLPTRRTASAVSNGIYFPMIFVSGAAWPRDQLPSGVQAFGEILPLTHAIDVIGSTWNGSTVPIWSIAYLGLLAACCSPVAVAKITRL